MWLEACGYWILNFWWDHRLPIGIIVFQSYKESSSSLLVRSDRSVATVEYHFHNLLVAVDFSPAQLALEIETHTA